MVGNLLFVIAIMKGSQNPPSQVPPNSLPAVCSITAEPAMQPDVLNGEESQILGLGPYKEWVSLPIIRVRPPPEPSCAPTARLCGPVVDMEKKFEVLDDIFCGRAISTYPKGARPPPPMKTRHTFNATLRARKGREERERGGERERGLTCTRTGWWVGGWVGQQGEPICDHFEAEFFEGGRTLVCIADGCSWGEPPRKAARKATEAYMSYLRDNQRSINDLRDAGRLILRAFQKAHIKILEGQCVLSVCLSLSLSVCVCARARASPLMVSAGQGMMSFFLLAPLLFAEELCWNSTQMPVR